jgi:hypothetical protein
MTYYSKAQRRRVISTRSGINQLKKTPLMRFLAGTAGTSALLLKNDQWTSIQVLL